MRIASYPIGKWAVIFFQGLVCVGTVMDKVAGSKKPKRIRIQRGPLQGKVVQPHQYEFKQYIEDEEIDP